MADPAAPRRPRIVVLQHDRWSSLGALAPVLEAGADLTYVRGYEDPAGAGAAVAALIGETGYDGVVALGGDMGVYDRADFPFLDDSLRVLEDALSRDVPILGICLGSQLLGEALASPVFLGTDRGLAPQVGFLPLRITAAGSSDSLLAIFAGSEPVFFWHQDTHDLPGGAALLASTDRYPVAAFRYGRRAYGVQFHFETHLELLESWIREAGSELVASGFDVAGIQADGGRYDALIRARASRVAALFVSWAADPRLPERE